MADEVSGSCLRKLVISSLEREIEIAKLIIKVWYDNKISLWVNVWNWKFQKGFKKKLFWREPDLNK